MSRWERWTTKPNPGLSFNKLLAEMGDPKAEAEQGLRVCWLRVVS